MFKFLFGGKAAPTVKPETHRERFARLVGELNDVIDTLPVKPKVTFDPATGHVLPETPEQFADEALALPAPAPVAEAEAAEEKAVEKAAEAVTEGDAGADATPAPKAPVPSPPTPNPPEARANGAG